MGKTTIEWTATVHPDGSITPGMTWNPIRGTKGRWHCTHVSEGCRNCYAERMNRRWGGPAYKPGADTFQLNERILAEPLGWKKPCRCFVMDMSDLFHEDIPDDWICDIFKVMDTARQHTFQVLTKRPQRMLEWARLCIHHAIPNIWLGVSVEDQATADERIPLLLHTPAAVRFVSYEPALGPVEFQYQRGWLEPFKETDPMLNRTPRIDWLIIGGESGPQARPFDLAWARGAIAQCREAGVKVFLKQIGSKPQGIPRGFEGWDGVYPKMIHVKHPKGGEPSEWPEDLRVREFPNAR